MYNYFLQWQILFKKVLKFFRFSNQRTFCVSKTGGQMYVLCFVTQALLYNIFTYFDEITKPSG